MRILICKSPAILNSTDYSRTSIYRTPFHNGSEVSYFNLDVTHDIDMILSIILWNSDKKI